ncbi:hypothetical protein ACRYJJ_11685 [Cylindrospermopsis raciborskii G7]|jgi:predicted nuclease with TOPRIM domain|uniref:hypothetical protein n=1 Tax=Cylindrospermopsis raciborskii TaxID=77022 RepID=UPI00114463E7|nr:hypothetical protein [Cylindrospermopsis raciborskii]TPX27819.1 hypothetical protein FIV49_05985 [Cylindrospermopsis raciborskii GIHE 2018]
MSNNNNSTESLKELQNIRYELENVNYELENLNRSEVKLLLNEVKQIKTTHEELLKEISLLRRNLIDTIAKGVLLAAIVTAIFSTIFVACLSSQFR